MFYAIICFTKIDKREGSSEYNIKQNLVYVFGK